MSAQTQFYLVAIPAVIILGLSKGGFSGLSSLAMPMLSLVESPIRAAAIVLPILIVQDWVSVWAFRRDFSPCNLAILIPASMVGVAVGWLLRPGSATMRCASRSGGFRSLSSSIC
jgi:uncharacterized protein